VVGGQAVACVVPLALHFVPQRLGAAQVAGAGKPEPLRPAALVAVGLGLLLLRENEHDFRVKVHSIHARGRGAGGLDSPPESDTLARLGASPKF